MTMRLPSTRFLAPALALVASLVLSLASARAADGPAGGGCMAAATGRARGDCTRNCPSPRGRGLGLVPFHLESLEEADKLEAVRQYHTQLRVMSSYLLSYVRTNELYSALPMPLAREGISDCRAGASDRGSGRAPPRCSRAGDRARRGAASGGG